MPGLQCQPVSQPAAVGDRYTTKPAKLLLISPDLFGRWLETPAFRNAVLGLFAERMADLTGLIDAIAFQRLDQRLAAALLGRGRIWPFTHQQLADELGTVRRIVSRLLRRFEREGLVELARNRSESATARRCVIWPASASTVSMPLMQPGWTVRF